MQVFTMQGIHNACIHASFHGAFIHDACIYDACIYDACIYDACIPDACFHDACIPDLMHVSIMLVSMVHLSMIQDSDTFVMHERTLTLMHVSTMHIYIYICSLILINLCMIHTSLIINAHWSWCISVWCMYAWCKHQLSSILGPDACIYDAILFGNQPTHKPILGVGFISLRPYPCQCPYPSKWQKQRRSNGRLSTHTISSFQKHSVLSHLSLEDANHQVRTAVSRVRLRLSKMRQHQWWLQTKVGDNLSWRVISDL